MGAVFKKTYTKPLPAGAEFIVRNGKRLARWKDGNGKTRTTPISKNSERISIESRTYTAKYRDGNGFVVEAPTGCRDESAARQVLADLEREAELVRRGVMSGAARNGTSDATKMRHYWRTWTPTLNICKRWGGCRNIGAIAAAYRRM